MVLTQLLVGLACEREMGRGVNVYIISKSCLVWKSLIQATTGASAVSAGHPRPKHIQIPVGCAS